MDMNSKKQYLQDLQKEYLKSCKKEKSLLLDEAVKRTSQNRNYLVRRLLPCTIWVKPKRLAITRSRQYGSDLLLPLVMLWDIFNKPCGQRLKSSIKDELSRLRSYREISVTDEQASKILKMSAKTIDTLLVHEKSVRLLNEKYREKKNPLLYQLIPTKMIDGWDREVLGQIQIDGVEHCGQTTAGEYANTVAHTDISSSWWEAEAVMGKGQRRTLEAIKAARLRFPFDWKEVHPDNGASFINYYIYDYTKAEKLEFSRSRPYHKNDNCFIEQKNSQNVRKVVGYVRYDTELEFKILNSIYRNELRLYKNFFQPVMRLESKERNKGHIYRKYQEAKTPYRWLMDSPETPLEVKQKLKAEYDTLNPADLKRRIDIKIKQLAKAYKAKHQLVAEKAQPETPTIVTFSNYRTTTVGLPVLIT